MTRTYTVLSEAWYGKSTLDFADYVDEILIRDVDRAKFAIRWYALDGLAAKLEVFDDAWESLAGSLDLIEGLGELGVRSSLGNVRELLDRLGFEDVTPRKSPGLREGKSRDVLMRNLEQLI